jgi:cell adhesion protein 4
VRPLSPTITGYTGSIEETTPLDVTCTTTGSRPRATLQWTIGHKNGTSNATERLSYITASDTYTVASILTYSVGKSDNGQVLICKADNVAVPSGVQTSITLNVKCKFKKYVCICLHIYLRTL